MLSWRWCWLALNVIYDICIFCNDLCVVFHWLRWIRHPFLTADTAVFYGVCTSTLASKQRSTTKFQDVASFLLPPFTILHGQVSTSSSGGAEAKAEAFFVPLIELPPPPSATIRYRLLLLRLLLLLPRLLLLLILIALLLLLLLLTLLLVLLLLFLLLLLLLLLLVFF